MSSLLISVSICLFLVAAGKLLRLRRVPSEQRPTLRRVCGMLLSRGAALLVFAPAVADLVDRAAGVPGLAVLLGLLLLAVAATCAQSVVRLVQGGRARTRRFAEMAVPVYFFFVLVALVYLVPAKTAIEVGVVDFAESSARTSPLAQALASYFAGYLVVTLHFSRRWLRWIQESVPDQVLLRKGVQATVAGNVVSLGGFSGSSLIVIVAQWFGIDVGALSAIGFILFGLGTVPVVVGMNWAVWGPWLSVARKRVRQGKGDLVDYIRLRQLWRTLRPVAPEMVHGFSSWRERFSLRSRLFWRVIEIDDWLHRLRDGDRQGSDQGGLISAVEEAAEMRFAFVDERDRLVKVAYSLKSEGMKRGGAARRGSSCIESTRGGSTGFT
ncbi:DUF6545 domain-containing protein [Amycolatopsis sp. NPDC049868]|uniref:DUF6545 domain-containing protein n=1 Tax=Amycolatopsis sp. NPDC049868 TaxID=3363934 RepID=UPI0037A13683